MKELEAAISKIDKDMVEAWVKDLVVNKTFIGFRFQECSQEDRSANWKKISGINS